MVLFPLPLPLMPMPLPLPRLLLLPWTLLLPPLRQAVVSSSGGALNPVADLPQRLVALAKEVRPVHRGESLRQARVCASSHR